ncbi:UNVERIFIED_CONTAM: hypothetical protein Sradi_5188700 [Sesamum radiatum]|uniref:Uncharacterized protein n=2 Tax=Sesamum TaxID=4181 RepID=A0AAE1WDB0_9LAMI|nr:hypothetical protein Sango_2172900 [Sesamum angolense]
MKLESLNVNMDGQKSQAKLTRTNSSLLRSSPTIRSSIHSLSSVSEIPPDQETDIEEQKPHSKPVQKPPVRSGSAPLAPVLVILLLSVYTLFSFFNRDDIPTSENLLLALILIAVLLFLVSKNKSFVNKNFNLCKQLCDDNGDFYEGEFHKGRCNGSGVYNYFVNGRYEGDWIDGRYDGYGIESWARGSRYKGQYRQGLRHGYGVYKFYTGDTYAGEWCNGQSHGIGVQTCADGSCYIGEFKCGVKHGLGCYHFRNGDRYAGEYFGDKIHGFGVYHFANGHYYEGSWHEGRKQGYGMYTFRNGETRCGEWDGGNLRTRLPPLTDAVLRAVQAARKTAENAIHLRRVDEQVNKAVVAANRAATAARVAAVRAVQNRIDGKFCDTNI